MNWLSKNAEALVEICTKNSGEGIENTTEATVDVAVVGSGYGGAVSALRFAEHGEKVYVLERGQEYVAGEFPNDLSQIGKYVRSEVAALSGVSTQGYEDGLFDFRIGLRAGALVGNGLGGGSLINAGVGLMPDPRVFKQDEWPAALRQADLRKYYNRAYETLELQTTACTDLTDLKKTAKYKRLKDLGVAANKSTNQPKNDATSKVSVAFEQVPIAVQLQEPVATTLGLRKACNGCGDCVTGCNNHAKLSLTATYLPRAVKAGAELFTGLTVLRVSHDPVGNNEFPWIVHFVRTAERTLQHDIQHHINSVPAPQPAANEKNWVHMLRARRVVLSAGTFGSSEILLRSRAEGLQVSNTALGMGVSGNGDDVAFGFELKDEANAVGWGSKPPTENPVGPTISGAIRFTDPEDVKRSTLIQDGAIPGLMGGVVHELLTTLGTLAQMGHWGIRSQHGGDPLTLKPQALLRSLTLLGMGHDTAGGVIVLDKKSDRVGWGWPKAADEPTPALHKARMKACVEKLGGLYIQNPAVNAIPDSMSSVLSGPKPGGALFTVHPLGGCRMGDTILEGVVNHWGAVWKDHDKVHDGLYVLDGSTIPSSLGVNPILTITALAERSCEMILMGMGERKTNEKARDIPDSPAFPKPLQVLKDVHASTRLAEVLRGRLSASTTQQSQLAIIAQRIRGRLPSFVTSPVLAATTPLNTLFKVEKELEVALFLQFDVAHWQGLMDKKTHPVRVFVPPHEEIGYQTSRMSFDIKDAEGATNRIELSVTGGCVELFSRRKDNWFVATSRWVRTSRTYVVGRWLPDYLKEKELKRRERNKCQSRNSFFTRVISACEWSMPRLANEIYTELKCFLRFFGWLVNAAQLINHANEVREFTYKVRLVDKSDPPNHYILRGKKTFEAAASWSALLKQALSKGWPAPQRRSLWQQLTELQVDLYICRAGKTNETERCIASGRLAMDLPDMMRRVIPQLGRNRDSLSALHEFSSYPLLFLRVILKTRLLDFRLPDYKTNHCGMPDLPEADPARIDKPEGYFELDHVVYPALQGEDGKTTEATIYRLDVPLTEEKITGKKPKEIRIGLVRYKAKNPAPAFQDGHLYRAKTIVLLNGFLLSTKAFVAEELETRGGSLATTLHKAGWDVWLFEYRASPLLDASAINSNIDDIAKFDIPIAINTIIETVSSEQSLDPEKTQLFAYSRCVGSAALSMSLLSGLLKHKDGSNKLAGVQISDFHPFLVGSPSAQMRLQLASFLSGVFKLDFLEFTAGTVKADFLHSMMDRAFSSAHYAYSDEADTHYLHEVAGQRCPGEDDLRKPQHDTTTCKRITGLMSRSYHHDQLLPETHAKLDEYFGRGNLGVFLQGAKCVEYERLVDSDGQNVYVNDKAIRDNFQMPLMLMHGGKNALFDPESFHRSEQQLKRILGNANPGSLNRYELLPEFGHVDLILGKDAPVKVFSIICKFFEQAFNAGALPPVLKPNRCRAGLPRTGPLVGWVRPAGKDTTLIRIWIELADRHSDLPVAALTVLTYGNNTPISMQAWKVQRPDEITYAVADVEVPNESLGSMTLQMFGIHSYRGPVVAGAPPTNLPKHWGTPMTCEDLKPPTGKGPGAMAAAALTPLNWIKPMSARIMDMRDVDLPATTAAIVSDPAEAQIGIEASMLNGPGLSNLVASSAQLAVEAVVVQPVPPAQPAAPISAARREIPLQITSEALNSANFISPMELDITQSNTLARMASPDTLSRQRRTLRNSSQRIITLGRSVVENESCSINFFAAACRHPGLTGFEFDRADASLLRAAAAAKDAQPRFMLMLGDQIYADARAGLIDTESPVEKFVTRYRNAFGSSAGFRKLAQAIPLYMVIDDHEINNDWSQEQTLAGNKATLLAETACKTFNAYQYVHGPGAPADLTAPPEPIKGFNYSYTHNGLPFIVLDTRTQRERVPDRKMLHPSQWRWLENWLMEQQKLGCQPKFIVSGSVVAPGLKEHVGELPSRDADTWQMSPVDRKRLLSFIATNNIDNVVFLSSDYHCSAAATITFTKNAVKAWAIVAPPLHAPMRFANSEASEVLQTESISLGAETAIVNAKAWDGEGWLECKVEHEEASTTYEMTLSFHLRRLEEKDWPSKPEICKWTLQA